MEMFLNVYLNIALVLLAFCLIFCLIRAIRGPRITDRIVAVNMIGTTTIMMIMILSFLLSEDYLIDVSILYAMLSFLSVVVLTKVYMGVYLKKKNDEEKKNEEMVNKEVKKNESN